MTTIDIEFNYMMLLHNHANGLTAYLPSAGHDAYLEINGESMLLQAAEIELLQDGRPWTGGGTCTVTTLQDPKTRAGFIDADTLMRGRFAAEVGPLQPRREVAEDPVEQVRELHARALFPSGVLTFYRREPGQQQQVWVFDDGTRRALSDRSILSIPASPGARYAIRVSSPKLTHDFDVAPGEIIRLSNADRPTQNSGNPPWYEVRYLLDLLQMPKVNYPFPQPTLAATPWTVNCPTLLLG